MIKLFEEYNKYYTEITEGEYNRSAIPNPIFHFYRTHPSMRENPANLKNLEFIQSNWVDFTQSEISTIHNLIPKSTYEINPHVGGDGIPEASIEYTKYEHTRNKLIFIVKTKDEWYYVKLNYWNITAIKRVESITSYYKCDQFEGLLKCIKDIL